MFPKAGPDADHASLLEQALAREAAYATARADGFFVPGPTGKTLIRRICEKATLPINDMMTVDQEEVREVAKLGVSRISFGPAPYIGLTAVLGREAGVFA